MAVDILRVDSNERVDLTDFEFISESVRAHERQLIDNLMCDPARTRQWVLSGFEMSNPTAKQLEVTKGKAILSARDGATVHYGVLTTEGESSLIVDMNSYTSGSHGIYIRFEQIASENQSRIFWDPAGSGSEYAQATDTRYSAAWSLRIEATSPGADWLLIGSVTQSTMAIVDKRDFYFEGPADGGYESGWSSDGGGSSSDRNSDRATYGISDFQMAFASMRQCITDLKGRGLREWYERGIGGLNVGFDTDPTEDRINVGDTSLHLRLDTDAYLGFDATDYLRYYRSTNILGLVVGGALAHQWDATSYYPNGAVDLGKTGTRWPNIYGTIFHPDSADDEGCAGNWCPTADDTYNLGSATREWGDLHLDGTAFIDQLALSVAASEGVATSMMPNADGTKHLGDSNAGLGSGNDYRWGNLFLSGGWQVENSSTLALNMYCGDGPASEKWWQFKMSSTGLFELVALDDSYANPTSLLTIGRTGVTANSAELTVNGGTTTVYGATVLDRDSGYPTTENAALEITGVNPFIKFTEQDTDVDAECRNWTFALTEGGTDKSTFKGQVWDSSYGSSHQWLTVTTSGGTSNQYQVDEIFISAYGELGLRGGDVVAIRGTGTGAPSTTADLGLTSVYDETGGSMPATYSGTIKIWVNGNARYLIFADSAVP